MHFLIYFALFYIVNGLVFFKVFQKAGKQGWEAFIPIYNEYTILKIIERPVWWIVFIFLPGLDLLFAFVVLVELAKSFGKFKLWEQAAAVLVGFIYFPYLGFSRNERFEGPGASSGYRRSVTREWVDAIIFALVAATVIRSFYVEAYTIPTPSLEETLLVDDYLFVSKFNYGARVPMTPLAFPLAHNTMPIIGGQSYIEWPKIPYYRLPGFQKIKNGDIVVFNYPAEELGRPVDKKDNYIKRCIAIPGDSMKIVNRNVYINGKEMPMPPHSQALFNVYMDLKNDNTKALANEINEYMRPQQDQNGNMKETSIKHGGQLEALRKYGIDANKAIEDIRNISEAGADTLLFEILMTRKSAEEFKSYPGVKKISISTKKMGDTTDRVLFPGFPGIKWSKDYYGPLYVPKKGDHIKMTVKNYYTYLKAIKEYEDNPSFTLSGDKVMLDGKPITEYVMKMDYYFMMGDNRDNSEDSRYWGFVPEDHIVGRPLIIWLSIDHDVPWYKKIRWNRMFSLTD